MKAKIIIELTISNVIDKESLDEYYSGNLSKCVRQLIKDEGHFIGLVDDKYKILAVEQAS